MVLTAQHIKNKKYSDLCNCCKLVCNKPDGVTSDTGVINGSEKCKKVTVKNKCWQQVMTTDNTFIQLTHAKFDTASCKWW